MSASEMNRTRTHKARLYVEQGGKCAECGIDCELFNTKHPEMADNLFTLDHIKPRCKGGETTTENLAGLCLRCNKNKGAKFTDYKSKPTPPIKPAPPPFAKLDQTGEIGDRELAAWCIAASEAIIIIALVWRP